MSVGPEPMWSRHAWVWWLVPASLGLLVAAAITAWLVLLRPVPTPSTPVVSAPKPSGTIEGRYLFNGTIFWGRGIEHWAQKGVGYDYAHPFSGLNTFNHAQYDAWVADLECPVTNKTVSFTTQVNNLIFNCRPEYVAEAAKYFNILNLANNHANDVGPEGLPSTRNYLEQAGIQHFGGYDPSVANDVCEVVALPVRVVGADKQITPGKLPVAFCAWHYFSFMPKPGQIEEMRAYSDVMSVFAFVHMGAEYYKTAQPTQVAIAHQVADQNPEFVIANNPHWVQNTEVYKGRLIVYSTGNFIFDQLDPEGMQSASIDAKFSLPQDDNTVQWLAIGKNCAAFHDDCLAKIRQQNLPKPKLNLAYNVVAGDNSGKLTKKGSPILQATIEQRTNWAQTQAALVP